MVKSFARAAGFLAYLFITLEMLFMVTPFALYYYSFYSPLLMGSFSLPATGWLPAFFLPSEPGEYLQKHLFGWVYPRRARLFVIYLVSLAVTISVAFGLREASLALTTRIILPKQKIAAVSFLSENEEQLRDLIQSAEGAEEVQDRIKAEDAWILVQAMQGKRPVVHTMIDAGMMRRKAEDGAVLAYCGQQEGALRLLRSSIEKNYCSYQALQSDPLLAKVRGTHEFSELLSNAKECQNRFLAERSRMSP